MKKTITLFAVLSDNKIIGMYLNKDIAIKIGNKFTYEYEIQEIELDQDIIEDIKGI